MIKPEQQIKNEEGDAEEFIEIVNKIMGILIFQYSIKEVVFVKIENWFDHKWLKYSGKTVIPFYSFGLKNFPDVSLESVWRDKISILPFNPNRVIYSKFFYKQPTGNKNIQKKIHKYRISNDNIHNRIEKYTSDGLTLWFSSNTILNQRGSLMVYRVQDDQVNSWYATIENKNGWDITMAKGIGINELKAYIK
jgi:hypothetical protein